jgi:hypothetical protein
VLVLALLLESTAIGGVSESGVMTESKEANEPSTSPHIGDSIEPEFEFSLL